MLNAFYDTVDQTVGPILVWVFVLAMTLELIYVMVKYLGGEKK